MAVTPYMVDVDQSTFQRDVVERSRDIPVVVDFWAPWCGPCRILSPVLTNLAQEYQGRFLLAKINVDENQQLAMQFGVQGIPMVKAFKDGRVVDEFVGAQPHPTVRQFIERLVPDPLAIEVAAGKALLAEQKYAEAEAAFRRVLARDDRHPAALIELARALAGQQRDAEAQETLALIPPGTPAEAEAERLRRTIELHVQMRGVDEAGLQTRLTARPDDLEARYTLANLLNAQGRYEEALAQYLEIIRRHRSFRDGAARQAMLDIFERLDDESAVRSYRNQLAMVLFA